MGYYTFQNKQVKLPTDQNGNPVQKGVPFTGGQTTVLQSTGTSAGPTQISASSNKRAQLVRVWADQDSYIRFGASDVSDVVKPADGAPTECMYLSQNQTYLFSLRPEDTHYKFISDSGTANVHVTEIGSQLADIG